MKQEEKEILYLKLYQKGLTHEEIMARIDNDAKAQHLKPTAPVRQDFMHEFRKMKESYRRGI